VNSVPVIGAFLFQNCFTVYENMMDVRASAEKPPGEKAKGKKTEK